MYIQQEWERGGGGREGIVTPMRGVVLVRESQPSDLRCTPVFEGGSHMKHVTNLRSVLIYTDTHTENVLLSVTN